MRSYIPSVALVGALSLAGCGSHVITPPKSQQGAQIQYMPVGCSYTVTSIAGGTNAQYLVSKAPATMPPKHVHAIFASDPSSSFAVDWESEPTGTTTPPAYLTELYYGTDQGAVSAATGATSTVTVQSGHTVDFASPLDVGTVTRIHEVHVCGLKPATKYFYKVGNTGAYSSIYSLTTAPAVGATNTIRFAVTGDARNDADTWDLAQKAIQTAAPAFQMFTGDAIDIQQQAEWDSFFEDNSAGVVASDVMASIPLMPANGNHEGLGINYLAQFAIPQQAGGGEPPTPPTLDSTKHWYSFNYGNLHAIVLNDTPISNDAIAGAEKSWLGKDLAAVDRTKTPWVIAFHHQPEYSCDTTHGGDVALISAWGPLFDQYHVDLVFNGHVHNYQRTAPMNNGAISTSQATGTTYIVAAGVGAPLYGVASGCGGQFLIGQEVENYVIVDINNNNIDVKAYNLMTGAMLDELTYSKG